MNTSNEPQKILEEDED